MSSAFMEQRCVNDYMHVKAQMKAIGNWGGK